MPEAMNMDSQDSYPRTLTCAITNGSAMSGNTAQMIRIVRRFFFIIGQETGSEATVISVTGIYVVRMFF